MDYETVVEVAGVMGLLLFMALFAAVLWWVLKPGAKDRFDRDAQIPFKED
jgi:cbb3-type cytochrome oxidase subunit 3